MSRTGEAPHPDPGAHGGGTSAPPPPRRRSRDKRATARLWGQIPGSRSPAGRGGLRGTHRDPCPGAASQQNGARPGCGAPAAVSRRHHNRREMETWTIPAPPRSRSLQSGERGGFAARLTPPSPQKQLRGQKKPLALDLGLHDSPEQYALRSCKTWNHGIRNGITTSWNQRSI